MGHMHPNLMGPTCLKLQLNQGYHLVRSIFAAWRSALGSRALGSRAQDPDARFRSRSHLTRHHELPQHPIMGNRRLSILTHPKHARCRRNPPQRGIHHTGRFVKMSKAQGQIPTGEVSGVHCLLQPVLHIPAQSKHHQSRSIHIKPLHRMRVGLPALPREPPHQVIHHGVPVVPGAWVQHGAGRLVDHQQILVLVEHLKGAILGLDG